MSNLIFQPYFEEQDQKAASFFATEHMDDYVVDMLNNPLNLINEAFGDIETLQKYKQALQKHNDLSNENFGFMASHIVSIENKYKGLISVETLVSESFSGNKKATIVAEGLSARSGLLIAGIVAAIMAMLAWILGKGKTESKKISTETKAIVLDTKAILDNVMSGVGKKVEEQQRLQRLQHQAEKDAGEIAKKLKDESDLKEKQLLEAEQEKQNAIAEEAKRKIDALNEEKAKKAADERDARNATAPHFVPFTSSSSILQQFIYESNKTELEYFDLYTCLEDFYNYYVNLSKVIDKILKPTTRYSEYMLGLLEICKRKKDPEPAPGTEKTYDPFNEYRNDIEKLFGVNHTHYKEDLAKFVSELMESEVKIYVKLSDKLDNYINQDYGTINCKALKAEVSYTHQLPHSVSFNLVENGSKKPKTKKFTLLKEIDRDQCYKLNEICEGFTNKTDAIFNENSGPSKDFNSDVSHIESVCKKVDAAIKTYGSTKKLVNFESGDADYMLPLLTGILKNIRSNVALASKLKATSEKQLKDCCELVNSIAKSVAKNA